MSIDIASKKTSVPDNAININGVKVGRNDVFAFDFDGVLSSSVEDDIYHLNSWENEEFLLNRARISFNLKCERMEGNYQRHLIFQAAANELNIPIEKGPGVCLLESCANDNFVFVITARSGWYAVNRLRRFFSNLDITPIEVFNLGRVKKDRQISLLCQEYVDSDVYYIEDNAAHLEAVGQIVKNDRLKLIWTERSAPRMSEIDLRDFFCDVVERSLQKRG